MAEESSTEAAEAAAKAKKKKMMMIGGLVVAALAYQFVLKPKPAPVDPNAVVELVEGEVAPIPELVVNLADEDEIHYLRLGVAAVLEEGIAASSVESELPKINDVVIDIVSAKTFAELRGDGATTELKAEISAAARAAFDDSTVVRVIFTTFVMQ